MTTKIRAAGEFCWINMLTAQPQSARTFFGGLLGWTFADIPGMGTAIKVGGRDIGAMWDIDAPDTPKGTLPHIGVMVKVDNADATCAKINALGGKATPPVDIADRLRLAMCTDPMGASIDLWETKKHAGSDVGGDEPGAPCWYETLTTDTKRAAAFYHEVFGWTSKSMPSPGIDYNIFSRGDTGIAGMMKITPDMGTMPAQWLTYFNVVNADDAAAKAVNLGGTICMPMKEVAGAGRFCGITSPQDVLFYVLEPKP